MQVQYITMCDVRSAIWDKRLFSISHPISLVFLREFRGYSNLGVFAKIDCW
jgi:hypothetical protein